MSGANFISEPVISFSITSISSRWYVLVIFNVDIRQNENYSSGSAHPHPTYSDPDHKYTHFSYANICFRTYDHTSFLAPVFSYPLCITDWNLILLDTIFRSRIHAISSRWYINYVPVFLSPMILQPLFRIRFLYAMHVLYTTYLGSKGICCPIVWLLVKWSLRGVYELTKTFFW